MKRKILILLLLGVFAFAGKDCPSRLVANLHSITDTLSAGMELRGFYYNVDGESYYFYALASMLRWEPNEYFSVESELNFKPKDFIPCELQGKGISPFVLRTLYLSYTPESEAYSLQAGRQLISESSGLMLDDFFDAVYITAERGRFSFSAGGGFLALDAARETKHCQRCYFYEYKNCWKGFCEAEYGDFRMGFLRIEGELSSRISASIMFLVADTHDEDLSSSNISMGFRVKLPARFKIYSEFALQRIKQEGQIAYGQDVQIIKSFRVKKLGTVFLKVHSLYATGDPLFTPIYGNISMGDRLHLTVRQGFTNGFSVKFMPSFARWLTLKGGWYYNSVFGSEFDAGLEISFDRNEARRLLLYYSRANTGYGIVNQFRAELRINI